MQIDIIFEELEQKYGEDFSWLLVQPDSSFCTKPIGRFRRATLFQG